MNPIALGSLLLACFSVCTAGAADVPPERMRAIYNSGDMILDSGAGG
jgi:hypothetical protein